MDFGRFVETNRNSSKIKGKLAGKGIFPEHYPSRSPHASIEQIKCPVLLWFSYEDDIVTPDIPIRFGRELKQTVVALSFEGGHCPLRNFSNDLSGGFGYEYDWMWEDYFAPFIESPDPLTFRTILDIHDPLGDTRVPDLTTFIQNPGQPAPVHRAALESLAHSIREETITPSQLRDYYHKTSGLQEILYWRTDITPEARAFILESLIRIQHTEKGEIDSQGGKIKTQDIYRIVNPVRELSQLIRLAIRAVRLYKDDTINGFKSGEADLDEAKEAILASDKLGKFFWIASGPGNRFRVKTEVVTGREPEQAKKPWEEMIEE